MAGRKVAVTAEQLHGAERDEAWRQITTAAPRFGGYERKTDRETARHPPGRQVREIVSPIPVSVPG